MPELFSPAERRARDRGFRRLLHHADTVLVHAGAVRDDILREYGSAARIVVIPFAPCPEPWWFDEDPTILTRYGIKRPFFMCSNQFWKHKNHRVLLAAIAEARRTGAPIHVVLTGATSDHRHPAYLAELQAEIADAGIADDVRILGLLPKADQLKLMRHATAVVQPSLFEGSPGGGSVHHGIALGRPTVVADLPVNREISDLVTAYFDPHDPHMLLHALKKVASHQSEASDEGLLLMGLRRRRAAGEVIKAAFLEAGSDRRLRQ
ncbi:glycosyltransferase family 4 protein [Glacieibacterium frigidum]|uniref:Glycosyltransferase family 4 protein n=1 Tax=Glacieibacterium frigidum TaxID=2593303 RepID=A0A552UG53_9SPHN|nr:glycosyltransferase family 4 protein [Glacieibacterium frigidum]